MKQKLCIPINGLPRSGKDTFCEFAAQTIQQLGLSSINISSVDKVKEIASKYCGWDGGKTDKDRKFLSDLKDLTTDYCKMSFIDVITRILQTSADVIFVHIREPQDIDELKQWCIEQDIRVSTLQVVRDVRQVTNNTGDLGAMQKYPYDVSILNDSTLEDFQHTTSQVITSILRRHLTILM